MNWKPIRDKRLAHGGAFNWFMQCRTHGTQRGELWCPSCGFADDHNAGIWKELEREYGWQLHEPAGDVPMEGCSR